MEQMRSTIILSLLQEQEQEQEQEQDLSPLRQRPTDGPKCLGLGSGPGHYMGEPGQVEGVR